MVYQQLKKIPKEVIWYSIFSVMLHQSGYLFLFFLIPMQLLCNKKGVRALMQGLIIVVSIIFVISIARTAVLNSPGTRLIIILADVILPVFLASGLLYINIEWPGNPGILKKIIAAAAAAYIAGIPVLLIFSTDFFQAFYREQVAMAVEIINRVMNDSQSLELAEIAEIVNSLDVDQILGVLVKTFMRGYLYVFFLVISGTHWIGNSGFREGKWQSRYKLSDLYLPEYFVWPLIAALAVVLIDYKVSTGFLGYTGWNIFLIMITLYGFRGLGIIQGIMITRNLHRGLRTMVILTIFLLLMQPGLNNLVLIGLPALGVSEIWINYNRI